MIWKPLKKIDNYELRDGYFLSESGDIINQKKKNNYTYKIQHRKDGYCSILLQLKDGSYKSFFIHRLVASIFIRKGLKNEVVDHINFIRYDNHYMNLRWVTQKENINHSILSGRINNQGENNCTAKIKELDVIKICNYLQSGENDYSVILKSLGLENTKQNRDIITKSKSRKNWSYISKDYSWNMKKRKSMNSYESIKSECDKLIMDGKTYSEIAKNLNVDLKIPGEKSKFWHFIKRRKNHLINNGNYIEIIL